MREIKFRAWDTVRRKMIRVGGLWDMHRDGEDLARGDWSFFVHDKGGLLSQSDYEFMQYTGLKDKNGVEIYEGDILIFWRIADDPIDQEEKLMVVYDEDNAMFHCGNKYDSPLIRNFCSEGAEVIGNVYENPELVEAKV